MNVRHDPGLIAGVLIAALVLSGCNGGDPELKVPKKSATSKSPQASGPPVSPAPTDVPKLNAEQRKAYDDALARYAKFDEFIDRVGAKPEVSQEVAGEASEYLVMPATKVFSDSIDQAIADGMTTSGSRKVEWSVPIEANQSRVVFRQCESPGSWRAIQDGKSNPQTNNIITRVEMVYRAGQWRVRSQRGDGEC